MKKQYVFFIMIVIILYLFYLIISFKYKEYKINENIEYITNLNIELKDSIDKADNIIKWKKSEAYINKALKEQQSLKNRWEIVVYLTNEDNYNKFTSQVKETNILERNNNKEYDITSSMTNYQKRIYLIFQKDIR